MPFPTTAPRGVVALGIVAATTMPWLYAIRCKHTKHCQQNISNGIQTVSKLTAQLVQQTTCYKLIKKEVRAQLGREPSRREKRALTDIIEAEKQRKFVLAASPPELTTHNNLRDSDKFAKDTNPDNDVASLLTVLITTSPVSSNPSTHMLEEVLARFSLVPRLNECQKIIVCDGFKVRDRAKHRAGCITADEVESYKQYITNLRSLAAGVYPESLLSPSPSTEDQAQQAFSVSLFKRTQVVELGERQGFGFAVKAVLEMRKQDGEFMINTPFLMVVQHDRTFMTHGQNSRFWKSDH